MLHAPQVGNVRRLVATMATMALVLAACGGTQSTVAPSADASDGGGESRIDSLVIQLGALGTEAIGDPADGGQLDDKFYMRLAYSYLFDTDLADTDLSPDSGVAESYEWSEDNTVLNVVLRQGVMFHNGEELKAEDVKFSLDRISSEEASSVYAAQVGELIESVEVLGDYEVAIHLPQASVTLIPLLSPVLGGTEGLIYPKAYFEEVGIEGFRQAPIGSGPYKLAEREAGSFMEFEAFDDYFLGAPRVERMRFEVVPEESTRRANLQAGQADMVAINRDSAADLEGAGFNTFSDEGGDALYIMPLVWTDVMPDHPLADERVREALFTAINRDEINEFIMAGLGDLTGSWIGGERAPGGESIDPYPYDPERARQLLQEAGWDEGELELFLHVSLKPELPEAEDIALAIASNWEEIGVVSNVQAVDFGTLIPQLNERNVDQPGLWFNSFGLRALYGPVMNLYHNCPDALYGMCDEEVFDIIQSLDQVTDIEEYYSIQQSIAEQLHERHMSDQVVVFGRVFATNDKVTEWRMGLTAFSLNFRYLALQGLLD